MITTLNLSKSIDGNRNIYITENSLRFPYFHFSGNGRLLMCGRRMCGLRKSMDVENLYKKICSLLIMYVFINHILKELLTEKQRVDIDCLWNGIFYLFKRIHYFHFVIIQESGGLVRLTRVAKCKRMRVVRSSLIRSSLRRLDSWPPFVVDKKSCIPFWAEWAGNPYYFLSGLRHSGLYAPR